MDSVLHRIKQLRTEHKAGQVPAKSKPCFSMLPYSTKVCPVSLYQPVSKKLQIKEFRLVVV